jgi:hypothetical protein
MVPCPVFFPLAAKSPDCLALCSTVPALYCRSDSLMTASHVRDKHCQWIGAAPAPRYIGSGGMPMIMGTRNQCRYDKNPLFS